MDYPVASTYGSGLTPQEKSNPHINGMIRDAQNIDLEGVAHRIDDLSKGPGADRNCETSLKIDGTPDQRRLSNENPFSPISSSANGRRVSLWATNYYTSVTHASSSGVSLKKLNERPIMYAGKTVSLAHRKWCSAAMEGSVTLRMGDGVTKTYNYVGTGSMQTDCTGYFRGKHRATGRVKFGEVDNIWGYGVKNYSLIPYRTIAVDPKKIPYGSVVFIPEAKGKEITLADGTTFTHDGYFFAGDTGGAIKGNQIDVFTGNSRHHNLNFVKSTSTGTFSAYVVEDPQLKSHLDKLHRVRYN